jgi:hypothetical protein
MFFVPRVNVVASDTGFSVEVLGRTGLCYREGDWSLKLDSEILMGSTGMVIDASSIRSWDPPHEVELIDDVRRKQIVENIRAAFRFRGFEIEVDPAGNF